MISEIDFFRWKQLSQQLESDSTLEIFPWQNLLSCSQYVGSDFLEKPGRKYYGFFHDHALVAAVSVQHLSPRVGRFRIPFCEPGFRRLGYTSQLLKGLMQEYDPGIFRWVVFSLQRTIPFYEQIGFTQSALKPFQFSIFNPIDESTDLAQDSLQLMICEISG